MVWFFMFYCALDLLFKFLFIGILLGFVVPKIIDLERLAKQSELKN